MRGPGIAVSKTPGPAATGPDYAVLSLEVRVGEAEAEADWIREALGREPVVIEKPGHAHAWLDVYFATDVEALLAARAVERRPAVLGRAVRLCRPRDWQRFWRHHFHVCPIGQRLLLVPAWERTPMAPARGRHVVRIEPGLSFGTGTHFTTRFCLEALEALCRPRTPGSLLDVGTGSGVIAIAAARLGVERIVATDHDPQALANARHNLRLNRLGARVRLEAGDIRAGAPRGRYDVVCANLFGRLLIEVAPTLAAATRDALVLSGIRESEVDAVAVVTAAEGLEERVRDADGEWCGVVMRRA